MFVTGCVCCLRGGVSVYSLELSLFHWSVLVGERYTGSELGWVIVLVRGWMVGLWPSMANGVSTQHRKFCWGLCWLRH